MTDLSQGDSEEPYIDVAPYDGSTSATLTLHSPADTSSTGTNIPLDAGNVLTVDTDDGQQQVKRFKVLSAVTYPAGGWWVRHWVVTGVGAAEEDERFFVAPSPLAGGPTWTPTREQVADYIPERTVEIDRLSDGRPILGFSNDTRPTGRQIDRQIMGAVAWVETACGTLADSLATAASDVAAIRAAGMAEISWPVRDGDINAGEALLRQADAALKALAARNENLTGVDPDDPDGVFEVAPMWSFPDAPSWASELL